MVIGTVVAVKAGVIEIRRDEDGAVIGFRPPRTYAGTREFRRGDRVSVDGGFIRRIGARQILEKKHVFRS
jgi:hypothetical protein